MFSTLKNRLRRFRDTLQCRRFGLRQVRERSSGCVARDRLLQRAQLSLLVHSSRGGVTAEYAIVIIAAVAFAGLLVLIMRSGEVQQLLTTLIQNALGSAG